MRSPERSRHEVIKPMSAPLSHYPRRRTFRALCGRLALLLVAANALSACVERDQVERLVNGQSQLGPFIDERAYAYYARGRILELQHSYPEALSYYQLAQEYDPKSVELRVRVGATLCQLRNSAAFPAFESAKELDPYYAPLFTELSRCYLLEGDHSEALAAATKAVSLDPIGVGPNDQMLTLLRTENDHLRVTSWYRGLLAQQGELDAWKVRQLQYLAGSDEQLLSELQLGSKNIKTVDARIPDRMDRELLAALATGNDAAFLNRTRVLNLNDQLVLELLIRSGKFGLAREIAETRYAATPGDADAWVQLLWLTTIGGEEARFDTLLGAAPTNTGPLSPASRELLSAVLRLKAGVSPPTVPLAHVPLTLKAKSAPAKSAPEAARSTRPGVPH